jgi:hypothetical protein
MLYHLTHLSSNVQTEMGVKKTMEILNDLEFQVGKKST